MTIEEIKKQIYTSYKAIGVNSSLLIFTYGKWNGYLDAVERFGQLTADELHELRELNWSTYIHITNTEAFYDEQ